MTVLNFAGMLGMVVPQSCASRKKRLMIDHGNHVHASIIFVDSCLRIAQNVRGLCCLILDPVSSTQPATIFRETVIRTSTTATGLVSVISGRLFVAGEEWCIIPLGICGVDVTCAAFTASSSLVNVRNGFMHLPTCVFVTGHGLCCQQSTELICVHTESVT